MGDESGKSGPPWSSRLLAVVGYVGLIPLLRLFRVRRHDSFLRHHEAQALATVLPLCLLLSVWPLWLMLETYLVRNHVGQPSHYQAAWTGITIVSLAGLGWWSVTSIVGIAMTIAGSVQPLRWVAWFAQRPSLMSVALLGNGVLLALVVLVVGLAAHASSLAREDAAPAPVYYLYDNHDYDFFGPCGPALHKLFFYRVSRVAQERWGPGNVVVVPLSAQTFGTAIANGRFVVMTGHGSNGGVATIDGDGIWPDKFLDPGPGRPVVPVIGIVRSASLTVPVMPGKNLRFVYISACDGGKLATDWEQRFAPAEVVTFDRLSAPGEHLWWLWFGAPHRLREIR